MEEILESLDGGFIQPVILCGGDGTRLWPASRKVLPKQFMPLHGSTLFKQTVLRAWQIPEVLPPIVICNNDHRFLAAAQLHEVMDDQGILAQDETQKGLSPAILLEPVGRNTAPAIAFAALHVLAQDPLLLILPSDHYIADEALFLKAVGRGIQAARQGELVTFGIVPDRAETGYGYIHKGEDAQDGTWCVSSFVEKPDLATAEEFLASSEYLWNSGIFLFSASAYLRELASFSPEMALACEQAYLHRKTDLDFIRLDEQAMLGCPADSIDYAVMEHTKRARVVPMDARWSDLGSWQSLYDMEPVDDRGNASLGDVVLSDCDNSFVLAQSRLVTAVGIQNVIVVETADAVMVTTTEQSQSIKSLVASLKKLNRPEAEQHLRVYRPWGSYESLIDGDRFQVKRIVVNPRQRLSLQKHYHRAEHWVVVRGTALVTVDGKEQLLREDESTYISLGSVHRLENPGMVPLEIIEIQTGSYLGEDDIIRLEDQYGR